MIAWSRSARLLRGFVVAGVGLGLALAGHVVGGGTLPLEPWLLLPTALAAAACVLASSRNWSLSRLISALAGLQVFVHATVWLASGPQAAAPGGTLVEAHHHASASGSPATVTALLGHSLAVIVTALVLRRGERVLVLLWRCARARVCLAQPRLLLPLGSGMATVADRTARLVSEALASADPSRAPPRPALS